ncbi:hypothetical protein ZBT109_1166 [Zymobacter palmae]|uniref:Uncharacterized protein n=1 Tax=Zymobacter palmae TaxID=33074 RepID=A0A348HE75_9GAMM|nr:hypothetical protein ZBT109_1166 [Zymobacter palmae]
MMSELLDPSKRWHKIIAFERCAFNLLLEHDK